MGDYGNRKNTITFQSREELKKSPIWIFTKTSHHKNTKAGPLSNSITTAPCQKNRYINQLPS